MKIIIIAILASVLPANAIAQEMTLEQCFNIADKENLTLQSARGEVERSRILQGTAWDVDKAELALSQDPTSGGSPDNALTLSQTIDFPTRYVARRHQLKAETNARQSEVAVVNNQLHRQIASLYYQLVYEKEKLRILRSQDSIYAHYEDIATKRYNGGEVRQLEPLNASRLRHENDLDIRQTETDYASTQAELARLLGTSDMVNPAENDLLPIACNEGQVYNYQQTPEGRLADARLRAADEQIKVEKSVYTPSLSLALRTQMVIKGWNPYHVDRGWNDGNFMGFEIGVGIPIFTGAAKARVKAAHKQREQLELQSQNVAAQRQSEYAIATSRMLSAKNQLDYYSSVGNEEASETSRISAAAYESGEISYIEYVGALQQSIDTQLKYASAINEYNQAVVALHFLQGNL